jgi:hypothetical protein
VGRDAVERCALIACMLAAAACTEPSFAHPTPDTGMDTPSDDGGVETTSVGSDAGPEDRDAAADSAARSEPEPGSVLDASTPHEASPGSDADASPNDTAVPPAQAEAGDTGPIAPPADAAPAPDPVPSWAKPLLGRFVKRSLFFAYDPVGEKVTVTVDVSLVTIAATDKAQLEWTGRQCSFRIHWTDAGASYTLVKPESVPPIHMWLSLGQAPHFSSDTGALYMGFDPTRQSRCSAGSTSAPKFEDQTWLVSRCTCSSLPEVLPTESSDCRVIDPDGDSRGGVALKGEGWANDINAILNTSLKITDAEVRADGEHLLHEQRTRNAVCLGTCFPMSEVLCPGGETLMRPLPANATCADAISKVAPIPLPPFPMSDCRAK